MNGRDGTKKRHAAESIKSWYRSRVHLSLGGICLGSVGLAELFGVICEIHDLDWRFKTSVKVPFYTISAFFGALVVFRAIVCMNDFLIELREPKWMSTYGSLIMGLALLFSSLSKASSNFYELSRVCLWFIASIEVCVVAIFLLSCWNTSLKPEPIYFPGTVSLAIVSMVGPQVDFPRWLIEITFWGGILLCIMILPICFVRAVRNADGISEVPTVSIMQAPSSFLAVAWFAMDGSSWVGCDDAIIGILFACSTFFFVSTVMCIVARRQKIFSRFDPGFAGFTFPTVSTVRTMVLYAERQSNDRMFGKILRRIAAIYAILLIPMIAFIICYFLYVFMFCPARLFGTNVGKVRAAAAEEPNGHREACICVTTTPSDGLQLASTPPPKEPRDCIATACTGSGGLDIATAGDGDFGYTPA